MGRSSSPAQLAAKMRRAAGAIEQGSRAGVRAAAITVTEAVRRELASAGVGDRLSGVGRRGARISVGYDIKNALTPTALVRMRGPAHLVERDTRPHEIKPKRAKAVRLADGRVRSVIRHPGTRGKHPFEHGVRKSQHEAVAAFGAAVKSSFQKVF